MTSFRYFTVDLRSSETSPKEIVRALAPKKYKSDPHNFFCLCVTWAGSLILRLPKRRFLTIKESTNHSEDSRSLVWGLEKENQAGREQWVTDRLSKYKQIGTAVYNYFYDTPMNGYYRIYRQPGTGDRFNEVEEIEYGEGARYFDLPRDYIRESVDYIQSKYGIHLLSYRELAYPSSRTWDFDVEKIC